MEQKSSVSSHRRCNSDVPLGGHHSLTLPEGRSTVASSTSLLQPQNQMAPTGSLDNVRSRDWRSAAVFAEPFLFDESETGEMNKENSHFYVCESVIAAVEQMKCRQTMSRMEYLWNSTPFGSEDRLWSSRENVAGSQEITQMTSGRSLPTSPMPIPSSLHSDTSGLYISSSSSFGPSASHLNESFASAISETTDETSSYSDYGGSSVTERPISETDTQTLRVGSLSPTEDSALNDLSAESVAISLFTKFSKSRMPETSDFHWLVSETDVNQRLLPLPESWPVAPDEIYLEGFKRRIRLRGNSDWAPPRPQLVFHLHPPPNKKKQLAVQNYKCAGCGMKLEKAYLRRIRYCEYLGKYFCLCCHKGVDSTAIIPAHVIFQWDFKPYSVSDFARKFLDQQFKAPVYDLRALNADIYKISAVRKVGELRKRLRFVWDYLRFCRRAKEVITQDGKLVEMFEALPSHILEQIHLYSIDDFCQIRTGVLQKILQSRLNYGINHVTSCDHCRDKGFFCEICNSAEILFPFQTAAVKRCDECGDCFHLKCIIKRHCPRCERFRKRREQMGIRSASMEDQMPSSSQSQPVDQ